MSLRLTSQMVKWQEFTLDTVQAALFTPEPNAFVPGKAVGTILGHFQDRFNGEMQVLPLPAEFPHEFPRVQLKSSDDRWHLSMGPTRADAIWRFSATASNESLRDVAAACAEMPKRYVEALGIPVSRLSLVIHRFCRVVDPANLLIERFCNDESRREPFNRSSTFEIHNHKVYVPQHGDIDYPINSWVRCKSALTVADHAPAIAIEQDLNTVADEQTERRFGLSCITKYFEMAAAEADQIIRKYFPD